VLFILAMSATPASAPIRAKVPPSLLPELLGFSPQLLLDDIVNIANEATNASVDGMETFLLRWAEDRAKKKGLDDWDSTHDVEQGLVSFQTLLENHTDIAFDFMEAWSLRNIFTFPPDLPIIAPHHQGLDLHIDAQKETDLLAEIESLRSQIDNVCSFQHVIYQISTSVLMTCLQQRRLKRLYLRALRKSRIDLSCARSRQEKLAFLDWDMLRALSTLPAQYDSMFAAVSNLPALDPASQSYPTMVPDPSKREWETSLTGYLNWATKALLNRTRMEDIQHTEPQSQRAEWLERATEEQRNTSAMNRPVQQ
jgi:kinetochore protein Mis12/MTW1